MLFYPKVWFWKGLGTLSPALQSSKDSGINASSLRTGLFIPFPFALILSKTNEGVEKQYVPPNAEIMEKTTLNHLEIVSEISVSYQPTVLPSQRPKIAQSKDAYEILLATWDTGKILFVEQFKLVLLNNAHRVIGVVEISQGSMTGTIADPKLIFSVALKTCATSIMIAHNHPSCNLQPSNADLQLTKKIKEGGKLLEITLLDHLIITPEQYFSFADQGLL